MNKNSAIFLFGVFNDLSYFFNTGRNSADGVKGQLQAVGNDIGHGGFNPIPGGPHRIMEGTLPFFNCSTDDALAGKMLLSR